LAHGAALEVDALLPVIKSCDKGKINETLKTMSVPQSSQSKLLRAMKMLSSTILRPLKADEERSQTFDTLNEVEGISWDSAKNNAKSDCWPRLFKALNSCLTDIGEESELYHVATGLLPSLESHFWHVRQAALLVPENRVSEEDSVFTFAERNRLILNTMIRSNSSLLSTGAFILLTKMPRVLDFDNKRAWFKTQLVKKGVSRPTLSIHVRRAQVFEDSFHAIMARSSEEGKRMCKFV
jgi:E3 ubiquitin-protein ligase HUWE1